MVVSRLAGGIVLVMVMGVGIVAVFMMGIAQNECRSDVDREPRPSITRAS